MRSPAQRRVRVYTCPGQFSQTSGRARRGIRGMAKPRCRLTIAFRRMLGELNSEVFVADRDGSNPRNLTNHPAFDGWPSWSPDGKQLVFASNRRSNYQIFIMNANGSNVRLVANTEGRATEPRWSPNGKSIYFTDCKAVDCSYDCEIFVTQEGEPPSRRGNAAIRKPTFVLSHLLTNCIHVGQRGTSPHDSEPILSPLRFWLRAQGFHCSGHSQRIRRQDCLNNVR